MIPLAVAAGYALLCWVSPYGACRACDGTGNHISWHERRAARNGTATKPKRRIRKPCKRCKGSGARLRIGRRLHNSGRRLHHDGTR
ncbi:hypothetical protein OG216_27415 [Streptomycetaceae bacterium NBC_01309]